MAGPALNRVLPDWMPSVKTRAPGVLISDSASGGIGRALSKAILPTLFPQNPDQWDLLREDRSLIPHAINESLRLESPVPQFSRVLTEDHEIGGVPLAAGSRVALLYASANRDERHYPNPTRFDITRRPSDHLAFGRGEHVCVGMHLARLEMSALLERLADRVARFEILERRPLINNGLRGLDYLNVAVEPTT
ncbi:cytochrome P450 [Streptomyces shenzhenensis]|uniref:cytochrome P450 n=1 Tax=Streptomyces shenzhenensis TaxID=943815 RepID=UPI0033EB420E